MTTGKTRFVSVASLRWARLVRAMVLPLLVACGSFGWIRPARAMETLLSLEAFNPKITYTELGDTDSFKAAPPWWGASLRFEFNEHAALTYSFCEGRVDGNTYYYFGFHEGGYRDRHADFSTIGIKPEFRLNPSVSIGLPLAWQTMVYSRRDHYTYPYYGESTRFTQTGSSLESGLELRFVIPVIVTEGPSLSVLLSVAGIRTQTDQRIYRYRQTWSTDESAGSSFRVLGDYRRQSTFGGTVVEAGFTGRIITVDWTVSFVWNRSERDSGSRPISDDKVILPDEIYGPRCSLGYRF